MTEKNNNLNVAIAIFGVIVLVGIVLLGVYFKSDNDVKTISQLKVTGQTYHNFGTISQKNGVVSTKITLKNESQETITINKVYTSCMCTTANIESSGVKRGPFGMPGHAGPGFTNLAVVPGQEATLEMIFDPNAHGPSGVGSINRSVFVETSAKSDSVLEFKFDAVVTP